MRYSICLLAVIGLPLCFPSQSVAVGTWTLVTNNAPGPVELMLLLSDGTVMAMNSSTRSNWYRLTPDIHGSYANGTWTTLASMHDDRLYFSSQTLTDGRVFVAGGEYGSGVARSEIYDPRSNVWTTNPVPTLMLNPSQPSPEAGTNQGFYDSPSEILADGTVLVAPACAINIGGTLIYNVGLNDWGKGPVFTRLGYPDQAEASWVKLPDDSILTIDPSYTSSERYIPSLNHWVSDATVPVAIYSSTGAIETGPAVLLPDGRAFFLGGTGHTAFYTPSGTTAPGVWQAGPDIPNGLVTADASAAMMVNGKILCAVGPALYVSNNVVQYPGPTTFYEFDPVANTFTLTGTPGGTATYAPYKTCMLDLPDGTVLYSHFNKTLRIYQPDGSPIPAGKPTITTITQNSDGSYNLAGTQLNGISEGAAYGDDAQMNSNYPLIRLADAAGNIYYARTYNWSRTGVQTGTNAVTTDFTLPVTLPSGTYSLVAVANGFSSDPVSFTIPLGLQIASLPVSDQVVLSWPQYPANAMLETAPDLMSGNWASITNGIALVGTRFVLTNTVSTSNAFFRLHIQ